MEATRNLARHLRRYFGGVWGNQGLMKALQETPKTVTKQYRYKYYLFDFLSVY